VISDGQHAHRIFLHAITFYGVILTEVYKLRPTTIDKLKVAIRQKVNEIPQEMTQRVMENFRNRLDQCIAVQGRHLEDAIFKS